MANAANRNGFKVAAAGANVFQLQIAGLIGKSYILQATTNFTDWVSLQTNAPAADPNVALPANRMEFSDPDAAQFPHRFYRVIQPQ